MTTKPLPPSRTADQFVLRFPDGMREKIAMLAKQNGRSMNSEIIERINGSFTQGPERALKTIEAQTNIIGMLGRYLKMTADIAKKGNPDKLEQLLFIEAMAQTMQDGEYVAGLELTTAMVEANKAKDASRAKGSSESADPSPGKLPSKKA